jgi:Ca-activated chloride channel homolog
MHRLLVLFATFTLIAAGEGLYDEVTQGALRVRTAAGAVVECPLRHTAYSASIAGLVAQVEVVQTFVNSFPEAVEAVYVFPLSHESGVNGLTMEIGDRRLVGALLKRADARAVYEQAKHEGKTATILDQERPNIFTQTVGNLPPGTEVRVRITYVERLAYDRGAYEFHLPLVVGPRYMPGSTIAGAPSGTGVHPDTDQVRDAARISPPVLLPGQRNGHDVAIRVGLDAGIAIRDLASTNHQVTVERGTPATATVVLSAADGIPNKDFVLRYAVAGSKPEVSVVSHVSSDGGWLQLVLQPAQVEAQLAVRRPRDLCFLVDVSGSMRGEPMAKVREAMRALLAKAGPDDRVQVITFASSMQKLFPAYLPATRETIASALDFSNGQQAGGGTEMLAGVQAALGDPLDSDRMRMVVMLTDGFIGNEAAIIGDVGTRCSDRIRFWCIGVGSSVNRFLIDGVATAGGGMGVVLGLNDDSTAVIDGLMSRLQSAQLDGVRIDWGGLPVTEVVPQRLPALWAGRPVLVSARFSGPASGVATVHGEVEGRPVAIAVPLTLPAQALGNPALRPLWARQQLGELRYLATTGQGYDREAAMTELSLQYGVMTEYTSFVAVDERLVNPGGAARRVNIAVPLPDGVTTAALPVLSREQLQELGQQGRDMHMGGSGAFFAIGAGGGAAGMFGSRSGGGRKRAVGVGGGSKASESCVEASLRFLKKHQSADGSWDAVAYPANCTEMPQCEPGFGGPDDRVALTAEALLAYLGSGYDHQTANKYKLTVRKGMDLLLAEQAADGRWGQGLETHAQATQAIAEAYAMTNDPLLRQPAQRAVDRLLALRLAGADGAALAWGGDGSIETVVTLAAVQALRSAYSAGLNVGDGVDRANLWLAAAAKGAVPGAFPAHWSRAGAHGDEPEAGLLAAILLGRKAGDPLVDGLAAALLAKRLPAPAAVPGDLQRVLWATTALLQVGGTSWTAWNAPYRDLLINAQRKGDGCFDASWDAQGQSGPDAPRGRLHSTLHALLTLEVYYRYAAVKAK